MFSFKFMVYGCAILSLSNNMNITLLFPNDNKFLPAGSPSFVLLTLISYTRSSVKTTRNLTFSQNVFDFLPRDSFMAVLDISFVIFPLFLKS